MEGGWGREGGRRGPVIKHNTGLTRFPFNYCRNDHSDLAGPWCYTDVNRNWDYCPIYICDVPEDINAIYVKHISEYKIENKWYNIGDLMFLICPPLIISLGTLGNALSVLVFSKSSLKNIYTCVHVQGVPFLSL